MSTGAHQNHGSTLAKSRYTPKGALARRGRVVLLSCWSPTSRRTESHIPPIYPLYPEIVPACLVLVCETLWFSTLVFHTYYFFTHKCDFFFKDPASGLV